MNRIIVEGNLLLSERQGLLGEWLQIILGGDAPALTAASSDASARRYWRLQHRGESLIAVDAPPATENTAAFVRIADALGSIGLNVPAILAADEERGFLLLSDLGQRPYLGQLTASNVDRLYGDAIGALIAMQAAGPVIGLPEYDADFLERELRLFDQWLLKGLLGLNCSKDERVMLEDAYGTLIASALDQPRVFVHRDFHSRNLMLTDHGNPGILDFQDAVLGPVTYDLVSLLRDCYIDWPRESVGDWAAGYFNLAVQSGMLRSDHEPRFAAWFDLMGMQRHLKAAGIFSRLWLRDGRRDYLRYLPRTLNYIVDLEPNYPEVAALTGFLRERVMPRLALGLIDAGGV
ncbi:MAG: phosphotransferase [Thiohalocapsa sp.]